MMVVMIEAAMAIKFARVVVSSETLEVGTAADLTCQFRKKPKETITKIIWSLEPQGAQKTNVFDTSQGSLESPMATVEQVQSKYNKIVKMILQDSSLEQVKVCCLVESTVATGWEAQELSLEACEDVPVLPQPDLPRRVPISPFSVNGPVP